MSNEVIVHKGRLNTLRINMGVDVSTDTITSEIRSHPTVDAALIATWDVALDLDDDTKLILTLDDNARDITANSGYMDLKRDAGSGAIPVFDAPLEVVFRGTVTA
jgi:hypothetical protein